MGAERKGIGLKVDMTKTQYLLVWKCHSETR